MHQQNGMSPPMLPFNNLGLPSFNEVASNANSPILTAGPVMGLLGGSGSVGPLPLNMLSQKSKSNQSANSEMSALDPLGIAHNGPAGPLDHLTRSAFSEHLPAQRKVMLNPASSCFYQEPVPTLDIQMYDYQKPEDRMFREKVMTGPPKRRKPMDFKSPPVEKNIDFISSSHFTDNLSGQLSPTYSTPDISKCKSQIDKRIAHKAIRQTDPEYNQEDHGVKDPRYSQKPKPAGNLKSPNNHGKKRPAGMQPANQLGSPQPSYKESPQHLILNDSSNFPKISEVMDEEKPTTEAHRTSEGAKKNKSKKTGKK